MQVMLPWQHSLVDERALAALSQDLLGVELDLADLNKAFWDIWISAWWWSDLLVTPRAAAAAVLAGLGRGRSAGVLGDDHQGLKEGKEEKK